jgi:hypothetical protein
VGDGSRRLTAASGLVKNPKRPVEYCIEPAPDLRCSQGLEVAIASDHASCACHTIGNQEDAVVCME